MIYYSYEEFDKDARVLISKIKEEFNPDALVAIARGGMTLAHYIAVGLDTRNLFSLNSIHYEDTIKLDTVKVFNVPDLKNYKKILVVDDMIDSGESMVEILKVLKNTYPHLDIKVATIFYKNRALIKPDFCIKEAKDWIDFFWDIKL